MKIAGVTVLVLMLLVVRPSSSTDDGDLQFRSCDGGNYTANSKFSSNLNLLLSSLSASNASYDTGSKGSIPDRAYGLFLCRGDALPADCKACTQNAAQNVLSECPGSKQGAIWYNNCQLRYSDQRFFSIVDNSDSGVAWNINNATDPDSFVGAEGKLLDAVTKAAAYNSSAFNQTFFATGTVVFFNRSAVQNVIYALAQCTRDLSNERCYDCLQDLRRISDSKKKQQGGRVLATSCTFRYETYLFFRGQPTVSLDLTSPRPATPLAPPPARPPRTIPTPAAEHAGKETNKTALSIAIPTTIGILVFLTVVVFCFWRRRRPKRNTEKRLPKVIRGADVTVEDITNVEGLYDLRTLKVATDSFDDSRKLGQGGFGTVYLGTLPNGENIAVKRLSASSRQGIEELKNELILVAKLQHKHLVRLKGVCLEQDEKLLVYEFMPNGSLDNFLFDPVRCRQLTWETRFKIIKGVARGLQYLHEESHLKVIHRDLKASNVLLDADLCPKISDFGLARLFGFDETQGITSHVVGTFCYMSPEYARRGLLSTKLDVYSFGILVLEIVTAKRSNGFQFDSETSQDILTYAWENWRNGKALDMLDPSLSDYSKDEAMICIHVALLCTQELPTNRPPMSSVSLMLHILSVDIHEPLLPKFADIANIEVSSASSKTSVMNSSEESTRIIRRHDDKKLLTKSHSERKEEIRKIIFNRQTV